MTTKRITVYNKIHVTMSITIPFSYEDKRLAQH